MALKVCINRNIDLNYARLESSNYIFHAFYRQKVEQKIELNCVTKVIHTQCFKTFCLAPVLRHFSCKISENAQRRHLNINELQKMVEWYKIPLSPQSPVNRKIYGTFLFCAFKYSPLFLPPYKVVSYHLNFIINQRSPFPSADCFY